MWQKPGLVVKARVLAIGAVFLALVGCFEVKEEITLNRDRSGTYRLVVDLGSMMGMTDSLGKELGESTGESTEETAGGMMSEMEASMDADLAEESALLEAIEGISNVGSVADGGEVGLSFDFENLRALQTALNGLASEEDEGGTSPLVFSRRKVVRAEGIGLGFDESLDTGEGMDMFAAINPTYTFVFTAPRKIRSVSNESGASLSVDGRTLTITASMAEIAAGSVDLSNEIRFR